MSNKKNQEPEIDAQAEQIKKRHKVKNVYKLESFDENDIPLVGWIRKPNMDEIGAFVSIGQNNPVKAAQVLLNSTWLEGDEQLKEDEENFLGVMGILDSIVKVRIATVKKL